MRRTQELWLRICLSGSLAAGPAAAARSSAGCPDCMMDQSALSLQNLQDNVGLDASQRGQFDEVAKKFSEEETPLHQERRRLVSSLKSEMTSKAGSAQIETTLNALQSTQRSMEEARYAAWKQTEGFLSPQQRARLAINFFTRYGPAKRTSEPANPPHHGWGPTSS